MGRESPGGSRALGKFHVPPLIHAPRHAGPGGKRNRKPSQRLQSALKAEAGQQGSDGSEEPPRPQKKGQQQQGAGKRAYPRQRWALPGVHGAATGMAGAPAWDAWARMQAPCKVSESV